MKNSMTLVEISSLLKTAVKNGVCSAVQRHKLFLDPISKSEAYKKYGRSNVDRWLKERLISFSRAGNRSVLERDKLEKVARNSNRITYLTTVER